MATSDQDRQTCFYRDWMNLQEQELSELKDAADLCSEGRISDDELRQLINKILSHLESYIQHRAHLALSDVFSFFSPTWCSSLERSMMWLGGCRPSSFIRLLYALNGLQVESDLAGLLSRMRRLQGTSGLQLVAVDELQRRTVAEENRLSAWVETLQKDVVDKRLVAIAMGLNCGARGGVRAALSEHGESMLEVQRVADRLRVDTLKEVVEILTPRDGVRFLEAAKRLQLCMGDWGREMDREHGRE